MLEVGTRQRGKCCRNRELVSCGSGVLARMYCRCTPRQHLHPIASLLSFQIRSFKIGLALCEQKSKPTDFCSS